MRIAGFIIGVLGALAAGALGATWLSDAAKYQDQLEQAAALGLDVGNIVTAGWLLVAALVAGIVGGVFALRGKGRVAAGLMIGAAVAPGLFEPKAFVFTFLLIVAGLVSLGAKPRTMQAVTP